MDCLFILITFLILCVLSACHYDVIWSGFRKILLRLAAGPKAYLYYCPVF